MSALLRVAVVGCGIAGAAVAARLGRQGHAVEGFERRTGGADGAGLLLSPPALAELRDLGLCDRVRAAGAAVARLHAVRANGAPLMDWDARRWGRDLIGLGIERSVLHGMLLQEASRVATLSFGLAIVDVDPVRGWITDERGERRGPYDLIVSSDGAGSRLRSARPRLLARTQRYAWTALSCIMRAAAGEAASGCLQQWFNGAGHVSIWPLGRSDEDGGRVCVAVNVPSASVPEFSSASTGLAELGRLGLVPATLEAREAAGPWIALACRHVEMRHYFDRRLVFLGDSAHSISPQLGQGTRLALAGAARLAAAIERHASVPEALARFDRQQRALARGIQRMSRWLTPLFQSQGCGARWLRERVVPPLARLAPIQRGASRLLCGPLHTG